MNKSEFVELFRKNVERAILVGETVFSTSMPKGLLCELHGSGYSGATLSIDEVENLLFIDEDTFYRIIDIGIKLVGSNDYRLFVRISPHPPSSFEDTWNNPDGNGPFKVLEPLKNK